MHLDQEQATYDRHREELKLTGKKYVLIKEDAILATFDTLGEGLKAGYERFGLEPFMLNAIQDEDYIIRSLYPIVAHVDMD